MTTLTQSKILPGQKLSEEQQKKALGDFHRDGIAFLRGVLTSEEVAALREAIDRAIDGPRDTQHTKLEETNGTQVLRHLQSVDRIFCDMLVREPFLSLAEAIVGPHPGFAGQSVIRSRKGPGISKWHIDNIVEVPIGEGMERHDPRMKMPVFWFAFQIALSDIDSIEHGPTEAVLGSHYSGRDVPTGSDKTDSTPIVFEGRRPEPLFAKAGDVYIFNYQTWHRGAPNTSDRVRYLMQNQYCKWWCIDRFFRPENLCNLSADEMENAPASLVQLLRYKK